MQRDCGLKSSGCEGSRRVNTGAESTEAQQVHATFVEACAESIVIFELGAMSVGCGQERGLSIGGKRRNVN